MLVHKAAEAALLVAVRAQGERTGSCGGTDLLFAALSLASVGNGQLALPYDDVVCKLVSPELTASEHDSLPDTLFG